MARDTQHTLTIEQAAAHVGHLVKVNPRGSGRPHWARGRIVGTTRKTVLIQGLGRHRQTEELEPRFLKLWKEHLPTPPAAVTRAATRATPAIPPQPAAERQWPSEASEAQGVPEPCQTPNVDPGASSAPQTPTASEVTHKESAVSTKTEVRKHNTHDRCQARKLEDWINSQWERIEKERPTLAAAAADAEKALGFPVTVSNVGGSLPPIGRIWPAPRRAERARGNSGPNQISALRRDVTIIAEAIDYLYLQLHEPRPNKLTMLVARSAGVLDEPLFAGNASGNGTPRV